MRKLLKKIFKPTLKSPVKITTKPTKDSGAFKITMTKPSKRSGIDVNMPQAESRPAIKVKLPEERHDAPKMEIPARHLTDAEALSRIVAQQPKPAAPAQPAPEKPPTIDEVVAALKRRPAQRKQEAVLERQRKKTTRKTKHDKVIAAIASRSTQAKPARKQSKR